MIKAISFDIGNTLIKSSDSISLTKEICSISLENSDCIKQVYREHFLTKQISLNDFCKKIKVDSKVVNSTVNQHYKYRASNIVWSDVLKTLKDLKKIDGIILFTLSNKSYRNPYDLKFYGLNSWFDIEIYSCNVGFAKPDVRIFQCAENKLKLKGSEIIHIGDSYISDYCGAKNAGWKSLLLDRENKYISTSKMLVLKKLSDLPIYIKNYNEREK